MERLLLLCSYLWHFGSQILSNALLWSIRTSFIEILSTEQEARHTDGLDGRKPREQGIISHKGRVDVRLIAILTFTAL